MKLGGSRAIPVSMDSVDAKAKKYMIGDFIYGSYVNGYIVGPVADSTKPLKFEYTVAVIKDTVQVGTGILDEQQQEIFPGDVVWDLYSDGKATVFYEAPKYILEPVKGTPKVYWEHPLRIIKNIVGNPLDHPDTTITVWWESPDNISFRGHTTLTVPYGEDIDEWAREEVFDHIEWGYDLGDWQDED